MYLTFNTHFLILLNSGCASQRLAALHTRSLDAYLYSVEYTFSMPK